MCDFIVSISLCECVGKYVGPTNILKDYDWKRLLRKKKQNLAKHAAAKCRTVPKQFFVGTERESLGHLLLLR